MRGTLVCGNCRTVGKVASTMSGSNAVEALLYLLLVIPGIVYSVVRRGSRRYHCAVCGSPDLVSSESPRGLELLSGAAPPVATPVPHAGQIEAMIQGSGDFAVCAVGESHYQRALARAAGGRTEDGVEVEVTATLVFEDSNRHDPNAVYVEVGGRKVGYLSREDAVEFRQQVKKLNIPRHVPLRCRALIVGGWSRDGGRDRGHFGIRLDFGEVS